MKDIMNFENILKYLSNIFTVFKRDPGLVEEIAEKRDIKNKVRSKKAEAKILRLEKKIHRRQKRLDKKKSR